MSSGLAFARDAATAAYYERRAAEYDEWYAGEGVFAPRHAVTLAAVAALVAAVVLLDAHVGMAALALSALLTLAGAVEERSPWTMVAVSRLPVQVAAA